MNKLNKKHQNARFIDQKLKTMSLVFFVSFLCDLQDFKFWYLNHQAFGTSFLHWVDFTVIKEKHAFQYLLQTTSSQHSL